MRCIHCPTPESYRCPGLDVRRFCELIDPACPQYDACYIEVIVKDACRPSPNTNAMLRPGHPITQSTPVAAGGELTGISADCCGANMPPGVFDDPLF